MKKSRNSVIYNNSAMIGSAILNSRNIEGRTFLTKEENILFNNRYITKGVRSEIPAVLQLFMYDCISVILEKDYLQIFRLSVLNGKQKIIHEQEQPEFKREYLLNIPEPITAKVYVIDDGDYCTMLLAEEY